MRRPLRLLSGLLSGPLARVRRRGGERVAPPVRAEVPLTEADLARACGWEELVARGVVPAASSPSAVAGLTPSCLFPGRLLYRRDDGRLVPVTLEEGAALVRWAVGRGTVADTAPPAQPGAPADTPAPTRH